MDHGRQQEILTRFGKRITQLRNAKKLTQRAFAMEADIDYTNLNAIEGGKVNPSLIMIMQLAEGFGVTPCDLFMDVDEDASSAV